MKWKAFVSVVGQLVIASVFAGMLTFVILNMITGCESWDDPACITPTSLWAGVDK